MSNLGGWICHWESSPLGGWVWHGIGLLLQQAYVTMHDMVKITLNTKMSCSYAAFYLSAFPNTTHSSTPRGILQGTLQLFKVVRWCKYFFFFTLGGLYDYPPAPSWDHMVDQSSNPKVVPCITLKPGSILDIEWIILIFSTCHTTTVNTVIMP